MKHDPRVELLEPVTVALAPPEVRQWAPYQFPCLSSMPDGRIQISFHVEADSATAYGLPPERAVSADGGRTWKLLPREEAGRGTASYWSAPLRLSNGDWLAVKQLRSQSVAGLKLPAEPVGRASNYGNPIPCYRIEDLPLELRAGWMLYRRPAGKTEWVEEQAVVRLPGEVRGVQDGVMTFPWFYEMFLAPDKAIWAVNYNSRVAGGKFQEKNAMIVLRSTDNGHTYDLWSEIPYVADLATDPHADKRDGFTEPTVCFMPDGSVFCLLRTTDGNGVGPMYWTHSTDNGRTWSKLAVFDDLGVWPQMLTLKNGVTLVVYGRPGLYIRATSDPAGLRWGERVEVVRPGNFMGDTCSYATLLPLSNNRVLMAYSDFNLRNADGKVCKGIQVREIKVVLDDPGKRR